MLICLKFKIASFFRKRCRFIVINLVHMPELNDSFILNDTLFLTPSLRFASFCFLFLVCLIDSNVSILD